MRKSLYIFALVSLAIFIYTAISLNSMLEKKSYYQLGTVKGFSQNGSDSQFSDLAKRYKMAIQTYSAKAERDQNTYVWITFAVTTLTAGSTLITSIYAAKKAPAAGGIQSKAPIILIAILAFLSTLATFGGTYFNDRKTDNTKKATDLTTKRNQLYIDYEKASTEGKASVILNYGKDLDL